MTNTDPRIYSINVRGKIYKMGEIGDIEYRVSALENNLSKVRTNLSDLFEYNSDTGALTINLDAIAGA